MYRAAAVRVVGGRETPARDKRVVEVGGDEAAVGDAVGLPGGGAVRADVFPDGAAAAVVIFDGRTAAGDRVLEVSGAEKSSRVSV